jgi:hypothetical protein
MLKIREGIYLERLFPSGAYCIGNQRYLGYTQKEAIAKFRAENPARKTRK